MIPYIEANYPVSSEDRTFYGWSCGANFGLYMMYQCDGVASGLFQEYIISNPVLKYSCDGVSLDKYEEYFFKRQKSLPAKVLFCTNVDAEKVLYTRQQMLATTMKKRGYYDLQLEIKEYEDMDMDN